MTTLAPKLPYSHPFAGGYPRLGGQPLPTDPDAIDYLNRQAAVDGPVEVGVAMAVDQFVKGCKSDSAGYAGDPTRTVWDAIKSACIMCGARTLAGALVPLKGTAPTPYNFASGDYSRSGTPGLKGNGSTKYLDTNRANNADGQNDFHVSAYLTLISDVYVASASPTPSVMTLATTAARNRSSAAVSFLSAAVAPTLVGSSRSNAAQVSVISNSQTHVASNASATPGGDNIKILAYTDGLYSANRIAFYSIGSAVNLALLDARVSTLVSQIAAAIP